MIQASAPPNAHFNSPNQKQRSALLLSPLHQPSGQQVKKILLMACGMTGETTKGDHGWVIAFDVDSFTRSPRGLPRPPLLREESGKPDRDPLPTIMEMFT
jgi:hypothetical protein